MVPDSADDHDRHAYAFAIPHNHTRAYNALLSGMCERLLSHFRPPHCPLSQPGVAARRSRSRRSGLLVAPVAMHADIAEARGMARRDGSRCLAAGRMSSRHEVGYFVRACWPG